jgi:tellurite resistance protein TehA-like permease
MTRSRAMQQLYGWPGAVADALCALAAVLSVVLGVLALARIPAERRAVLQELEDPVQSPFAMLPFIVVMLLGSTGLATHSKAAGDVLLAIGLVGSLLLGAWLTGDWLAGPIDARRAHPGYFIPALGPGMIGALTAGSLGRRLGLHVLVGGRDRPRHPLAGARARGGPARLRRHPHLPDHGVHRRDRRASVVALARR